jgi:predicted nucleic acid-binding protein
VADRWVINASPLVLLAKAGILHFLPSLCDELVIPSGVVAEVQAGSTPDLARVWLASHGLAFVRPSPERHPDFAIWRGGLGEAEVISWALKNREFTAALDDRRARNFAIARSVRVIGSLRIIVLAKEKGLISRAKPALEKLRGAGAFVSDALVARAIELAGE